MSDFDDASLVLIPSGYKTSKVYSVKPTDGTGDLTFTRSNDTATRFNSAGLIEKVRTNLVLQSETFSNASWAKINSATATGDTTTAPNGTTTADTITGGGSSSTSRVRQSFAFVAGAEYAISIYVKANDSLSGRFATLNGGGTTRTSVTFTNTAGVVAISGSSGGGTTDIESVGSGWYRISHQIVINDQTTLDFFPDINGTNLSWYAWGAMIETGVLTPYIGPTLAAAVSVGPVANVPRLDYLNSTCPKLILEPQRTNVITFSETFNNAAWTKSGATITANATTSPDGYLNADKLVENSSLSSHYVNVSNLFTADGSLRAWSLFVKEGERRYIFITNVNTINSDINCVVFDTRLGVFTNTNDPTLIVTRKVQALENGWYRIDFTSAVNNGAYDNFFIGISSTSNMSGVSYLGDGTSGLYIYGAQLELGAYATSYIPTLGAAVTRGADACVKTGISSLIGQTEGVLFVDFVAEQPSEVRRITLSDGTSANRILIGHQADGTIQFFIAVGSASQVSFNTSASYTKGTRLKIAFAYKANDFAAYINGAQVLTDNSGTVPASSKFAFADAIDTNPLISSVNQALLFKTRLPNSELASLTNL